ncbi:MAG: hypothetical protein KGL48_13175 [Sphingomonadales bacterium]|nr:hypothetical protein [Sphingomonadales bacterium]MDE2570712.1 hypothetical protein [Sphingomonadales bacterium]
MPSCDLEQEWSRSPDTVLPWTAIAREPVRFGKVEIVQYDAGPAHRVDLLPRDSVLEMLLPPSAGRIERSGRFEKVSTAHPMGDTVFLPAHHPFTADWPATGPVRAIRCHYQLAESLRVFSEQELIVPASVSNPRL